MPIKCWVWLFHLEGIFSHQKEFSTYAFTHNTSCPYTCLFYVYSIFKWNEVQHVWWMNFCMPPTHIHVFRVLKAHKIIFVLSYFIFLSFLDTLQCIFSLTNADNMKVVWSSANTLLLQEKYFFSFNSYSLSLSLFLFRLRADNE